MLFMAPELFLTSGGRFTEKSDMWSMGVILAWIGTALQSGKLQHPMLPAEDGEGFNIEQYDLLCAYRSKEPLHEAFFVDLPEAFQGLVSALLKYEPDRRIGAQKCLKNSWVAEGHPPQGGIPSQASPCGAIETMLGWSRLAESDRSMLSLVAGNLADEDVSELTRAFEALDTQKTGQLTKVDFVKCLQSWRGSPISEKDIEDLFANISGNSPNGSDTIDYHEWLCATISHSTLSGASLAKAFDSLDSTRTGKIKSAQLEPIVGEEGAKRLVRRFSRKGTPGLFLEDFSNALQAIITERDTPTDARYNASDLEW